MNVYFNLNLTSNCSLQIQDLTQEYDEYLPEDSNLYVTPGRFKYIDTYTVDVIKYVGLQKTDIVSTIITSHVATDGTPLFCDETYHCLTKDGHYIIDHIIIPSINCVQSNVNPQNYDFIYATDGVNFFKLVENSFEECSILELTEINSDLKTTISKASQETFSLCLLNNKFLELSKQQFENLIGSRCKTKSDLTSDLDLIWVSLNAIKYNVELGMLNQAQSLIEDIYSCSGIPQLINNSNNSNNGCGCGL